MRRNFEYVNLVSRRLPFFSIGEEKIKKPNFRKEILKIVSLFVNNYRFPSGGGTNKTNKNTVVRILRVVDQFSFHLLLSKWVFFVSDVGDNL